MYLCVGFTSGPVQEEGPCPFDAIRDGAMRNRARLPLNAENVVGFLSYGRDGLLVGNVLIPREKCVVNTVTRSRVRFGLLPTGKHVLLPLRLTGRAGTEKRGRSVLDMVLTVMDERSPEVRFEAFGVYGEDICISLPDNAVISNGGQLPVEFTLKLCGRMSNIYFAEALARTGDCSLLKAYLVSYIDALCVCAVGHSGKRRGVPNQVSSFLDSLNGGNLGSSAYSVARKRQIDEMLWLLRMDHVCHGVLDTIGKYCGRGELSSSQQGVLRALTNYVVEAERRCSIKENDGFTGQYVIDFSRIVREQNFPFCGDTSYTRALKGVEGLNSCRGGVYSEKSTCRLDGVMLIDVPVRKRREVAPTTQIDADVSLELAQERGRKGFMMNRGGMLSRNCQDAVAFI